jgi:hypothetical protein
MHIERRYRCTGEKVEVFSQAIFAPSKEEAEKYFREIYNYPEGAVYIIEEDE